MVGLHPHILKSEGGGSPAPSVFFSGGGEKKLSWMQIQSQSATKDNQ